VHTYSAGTLVYEVNLSVPREKAEDYIEWLRGFTKVKNKTKKRTTDKGKRTWH